MNLNLARTAKYYFIKFKRLRGDPHSLALGTALGIFIGVTPTIPLHTVLIISLALLLRASTIAGLISATVISNPLTMPFQYYLSWLVGNFLFPGRLNWERILEILEPLKNSSFMDSLRALSHLGGDTILVMLSGGIVLAAPLAVATYFLTLRFFCTIQKRRQNKHLLN